VTIGHDVPAGPVWIDQDATVRLQVLAHSLHRVGPRGKPAMNATTVREVMTKNPLCLPETASVQQAARAMRDSHIGDVLVINSNEKLAGIVTDRDIVVRAVADGLDAKHVPLGRIMSRPEHTLEPDEPIERTLELMRKANVRRIPVVENGRPLGIVSLGDLAVERDPNSVLGRISSSPANN
jgi:CBS domain-containing protein